MASPGKPWLGLLWRSGHGHELAHRARAATERRTRFTGILRQPIEPRLGCRGGGIRALEKELEENGVPMRPAMPEQAPNRPSTKGRFGGSERQGVLIAKQRTR